MGGMSAYTIAGLAVIFAIMVALFGIITNSVLRERGFGLVLNGLLMAVGFTGGVFLRYLVFGAL